MCVSSVPICASINIPRIAKKTRKIGNPNCHLNQTFSLQKLQRNSDKKTLFVAGNSALSLRKMFEFANKSTLLVPITETKAVSLQPSNPTHAISATKPNHCSW
jgi:hypothetical protein